MSWIISHAISAVKSETPQNPRTMRLGGATTRIVRGFVMCYRCGDMLPVACRVDAVGTSHAGRSGHRRWAPVSSTTLLAKGSQTAATREYPAIEPAKSRGPLKAVSSFRE